MLSALEIFLGYALYKFTFYLLTLLTWFTYLSHSFVGDGRGQGGRGDCVVNNLLKIIVNMFRRKLQALDYQNPSETFTGKCKTDVTFESRHGPGSGWILSITTKVLPTGLSKRRVGRTILIYRTRRPAVHTCHVLCRVIWHGFPALILTHPPFV